MDAQTKEFVRLLRVVLNESDAWTMGSDWWEDAIKAVRRAEMGDQ